MILFQNCALESGAPSPTSTPPELAPRDSASVHRWKKRSRKKTKTLKTWQKFKKNV